MKNLERKRVKLVVREVTNDKTLLCRMLLGALLHGIGIQLPLRLVRGTEADNSMKLSTRKSGVILV